MNVKLFGISREIIGKPVLNIDAGVNISRVGDLKIWLTDNYPQLSGLRSFAVAVDNEYAGDEQLIQSDSEIALIPPVSGG